MSTAQDKKKVIELLNQGRAAELTAIMQYMAQHYELDDADYGKLAKIMKTIGIQEMNHAEQLAERILYLGGTPTSEPDGKVTKGQDIAAMLKRDIGLETGAVEMYNASAMGCAKAGDHTSKQLFQDLLQDEEEHLGQFQNIQDHVAKLGDAYLATLVGDQGGEA
ncbi:MAG: bacterioferritin [Planctomycetes bacterium]|nr:bacterioferritin [Planctomycetota bacterium]